MVTFRTVIQSNSLHQEQLNVYSFHNSTVGHRKSSLFNPLQEANNPAFERTVSRESWKGVFAFTCFFQKEFQARDVSFTQLTADDSGLIKIQLKVTQKDVVAIIKLQQKRKGMRRSTLGTASMTEFNTVCFYKLDIDHKEIFRCMPPPDPVYHHHLGTQGLSTHDGVTVVFCCVESMNNERWGDADFFKSCHRNGASPRCNTASNMFTPLFLCTCMCFRLFLSCARLQMGVESTTWSTSINSCFTFRRSYPRRVAVIHNTFLHLGSQHFLRVFSGCEVPAYHQYLLPFYSCLTSPTPEGNIRLLNASLCLSA